MSVAIIINFTVVLMYTCGLIPLPDYTMLNCGALWSQVVGLAHKSVQQTNLALIMEDGALSI